ncbi:hypothetical protein [Neobacillus niacini]|uniref:hypothetical protein n=1 Tax=Neobacillus niacini TaxID=86668 RepID=UPI0021CB629C|nr:hypothetical protein [Neobacillus niacini]MCM3764502.1 hypothetical protein [Neobacillus niacini]
MDLYKIAENINILSDFLGKKEIDSLSSRDLEEKYYISQADLLILFGGSIGYGPNGKNYIAHVDIPVYVLKAYDELKVEYGNLIRAANPLYASKQ